MSLAALVACVALQGAPEADPWPGVTKRELWDAIVDLEADLATATTASAAAARRAARLDLALGACHAREDEATRVGALEETPAPASSTLAIAAAIGAIVGVVVGTTVGVIVGAVAF